jgi:hypothetical protein
VSVSSSTSSSKATPRWVIAFGCACACEFVQGVIASTHRRIVFTIFENIHVNGIFF